jgi:hypothetical protein
VGSFLERADPEVNHTLAEGREAHARDADVFADQRDSSGALAFGPHGERELGADFAPHLTDHFFRLELSEGGSVERDDDFADADTRAVSRRIRHRSDDDCLAIFDVDFDADPAELARGISLEDL